MVDDSIAKVPWPRIHVQCACDLFFLSVAHDKNFSVDSVDVDVVHLYGSRLGSFRF